MKNIQVLLLLVFLFSNYACKNNRLSDEEMVEIHFESSKRISNHFYYYFVTQNVKSLDSSIVLIDSLLELDLIREELFLVEKAYAYLLKNEFDIAISIIESIEEDIDTRVPYQNDVLLLRFKAMQAQIENDIELRNEYIFQIIEIIENYLEHYEDEVYALFFQDEIDERIIDPADLAFNQLYFYKAFIFERDSILVELDEMRKIEGVNHEFIDYLCEPVDDEMFMVLNGF